MAYAIYRPFADGISSWREVLSFGLRGYGKDVVMVVGVGVVVALLGMLTPLMTAALIDSAIPDANRAILLQIGLALLAAAFGQALFQLAQGFALMRLHTGTIANIRAAMWDRLLTLRSPFYRQYAASDLYQRMNAIGQIASLLNGGGLAGDFHQFFIPPQSALAPVL